MQTYRQFLHFFFMLVLKHDFKDTLTCKYRQMFTAMLNENWNDLLFKS